MFPACWDLVKSGTSEAANPNEDMERIALMRVSLPTAYRNAVTPTQMPMYHRIWFQPDSVGTLDNQTDAKELEDIVQEGIKVVVINNKIIHACYSELTKEWSWCGAAKGRGAYPPAPVEVALDFQDRINDRANTIDEFHDRAGSPPILFDQTILGEALNGKFLPPASLLGIPANRDIGRKLEDAFWQPTFHMDNGIYNWLDKLLQLVQLLEL